MFTSVCPHRWSGKLGRVTITVYGKPDCVQCEYTTKELKRKHLPYTYFDVTEDEVARKVVLDSGKTQLPMVVVEGREPWFGFRPQMIRDLQWGS